MKTVSMQDMVNIIDEKNKIIQEQATEINQLKNRWISVDDRLPDCRVLIKTTHCGMLVAGRSIFNNSTWNWGCINHVDFEQNEVTHWQPLPTPPTKEND